MTLSPPRFNLDPRPTAPESSPGPRVVPSIGIDYADRALSRASSVGAAVLFDGRAVLFCDRLSGHAERYSVTRDDAPLGVQLTARQAWAVVAALHVELGG